ncbi:MAG: LamG-like jellyroll fold domain-containing protein [bacterium]
MNKKIILAAAMLMAFAIQSQALDTNTWNFSTNADYYISPSDQPLIVIDTTQSVARLILLSENIYHTTFAEYVTNGSSHLATRLGPDMSLALQRVGETYRSPGIFTSRVLDGGNANMWQRLTSVVSGREAMNSGRNMTVSSGGLAALYHLDNSWRDEVSGINAVNSGAGFVQEAKIGRASATFTGGASGNSASANAALLNGATGCTFGCWIKFSKFTDYGGIFLSRSSGGIHGLDQWLVTSGGARNTVGFFVNGYSVRSNTQLELNKWYHIAGTWSSALREMRLYVNGISDNAAPCLALSMAQDGIFRFNYDSDALERKSDCRIDEMAVFSRALSPDETIDLYWQSYSLMFQLRSGASVAAVTNSANVFTGPDGRTNAFYFSANEVLSSTGSLSVSDRYAQYKMIMYADAFGSNSPWVDAVSLIGDRTAQYDYSFLDFQLGTIEQNVTIFPAKPDTPYVGLSKYDNGGYYTNGYYESRIFDAGSSVTWEKLTWDTSEELPSSIPGLIGLYHLNANWANALGTGNNGVPSAPPPVMSRLAKLGGGCFVFDGVANHVNGFGFGNIKSVEFWISNNNPEDSIMTFGAGPSYLSVSNGIVVTGGFTNTVPQIYVNGRLGSRKLMPGWNHVALVSDTPFSAAALDVGVANGDYMKGAIDEMAVYSRAIQAVELKSHYLLARQSTGGNLKFQVRSGDSIATITSAVWSVTEYSDPANANPGIIGKNCFQYRATLERDGNSTPAFRSVTVQYWDGVNPSTNFYDFDRQTFGLGTFVNGQTKWAGDEELLSDQSQWGPLNLAGADVGAGGGLWHMDEPVWGVVSNSTPTAGLNGTAFNGAAPSVDARVGFCSGAFKGTNNNYVLLGGPVINGANFTVAAWVKSTDTNRSAIISTYSGSGPGYALEFNGDGSTNVRGKVAFVVDDGALGMKAAASVMNDLNDGRWHHIAGVRDTDIIHLYVDGDRVCSAYIGAYGSVGSGGPYVARYGVTGKYLLCNIDEVLITPRALSDAEVGDLSGAAYRPRDQGIYTSEILDATRFAIWQTLSWSEDAPYNKPLSSSAANLVALWHLDTNAVDSAMMHDGTLVGGPGYAAGRFNSGISLSGGQYVNVTDSADLKPASNLTIEAWANFTDSATCIVVDKSNGGAQGYRLATDLNGRPYFKVGALTCTDPVLSVRNGKWTHLAGTYDGQELVLYVDGEVRARKAGASTVASVVNLHIGADNTGANGFVGTIDEVAFHDRVLLPGEIFDHYRAGAVTLKLQGRSGTTTNNLLTSAFVGSSGTSNSFYTVWSGESLLTSILQGQYFQYRAYLSTENHRFTPRLQGVRVDASSYSTNNPAVENANSVLFPGKLTMFSHVMATNNDTTVRYQISGDNGTTWYFWPSFTNKWVNEALYGGGWDCANPVGTINANIGSIYRQLYEKTGINIKWRAFLHSEGSDQVAVDSVSVGSSQGRIVVTEPNGTETNKNAWLIGTTNMVRWSHAGILPGTVTVQYSNENSGGVWVNIATSVTATADICPWLTPSVAAIHTLVRILHNTDATIWDVSDGEFELVQKYRVVWPNGGETLYIGETNVLVWGAAQGLASVNLDFSGDDTWTNPVSIGKSITSRGGVMSNIYAWTAIGTNPALPSETARIRVQTPGGSFTDYSDDFFVHAGAAITAPEGGSKVKQSLDEPYSLTWKSAGCGGAVKIELQTQIGGAWTTVSTNVANVSGWNSFTWMVTNNPTEEAKLRITSLSDPRAKGESAVFVIAAIDVKSPHGDPDPSLAEKWLMDTTQTVAWLSAGASASVNIYYSTDGGSNWMPVAAGYANNNTAGFTNTFQWVVSNTPSARARIKVEDFDRPLDLWSKSRYNFHIAGLRVVYPNGPISQEWLKGIPGIITWEDNGVGNGATVEISYTGGTNWLTVSGPGQSLIDKATPPFTPTLPTVRGLVRITADDATPFTNVFDQSDAYFAVAGVLIEAPTSSVFYTIGTTNTVTYVAAATHAPGFLSDIYYSSDGVTFDKSWPIKSPEIFSETFPGRHGYDWVVEPLRKPSKTARIMVTAGSYTNISQQFTLRGMRIRQPAAGTIWARGDLRDIQWDVAGIALSSEGDVYVSTEGSAPAMFTNKVNGARVVINDGGAAWSIPANMEPTTNAYAKVIVTYAPDQPIDIGQNAYSQVFTVRGLKMLAPTNGAVSQIGGPVTIQWKAADAGASVNIYYSSDNGTNYEVVALAQASGDGIRSYVWNVEMSRKPSLTAKIKVVSATGLQDASQAFVMQGIKITEPRNQFVFARSSLTNMIRWAAVGDAGPYALSWTTNGTVFTPIQTVAVVREYNWDTIPAAAVSPTVVLKIVGAGFSNTSEVFTIVSQPAIFITSPIADSFWGVGVSHNIQWRRAGDMTKDFTVLYSLKPYAVTNDITDTPNITYDDNDKTYTMPWTVPDQPTQARLIVKHNTDVTIADMTGAFNLCGRFEVLYPNGGEGLFALQPTPVVWRTIGTIPLVDVYYSETPPYWAGSWTKINTAPIANKFNSLLTPEQTTWSWEVANSKTTQGRFRVQEAQYTNTFDATELMPAGREQPADESDTAFAIRYYTVYWEVVDMLTTQRLDRLAVIDSSGWSASSQSCILPNTISHDYPWGVWNTVWYREFFFDMNIVDWKSENVALGGPQVWTQQVFLARSTIEPEYHTMASFSYEPTNKVFTIHGWIERGGTILDTPTKCIITMYNASGSTVAVVDSSTISGSLLKSGVFWMTWDASALAANSVLFAKVDILFSSYWYSSGVTFTLRVPMGEELSPMLTGISNQVVGVYTSLQSHESAQAIFRGEVRSNLTSIAGAMGALPGLTNLTISVSNLLDAVGNVAKLTNITELAQSLADIRTMVSSQMVIAVSTEPRITFRATTIKSGTTNIITYMTTIGLGSGPQMKIQNSAGALVFQANMTEVPGAGMYKGEATFAAGWGLGEFTITCNDSVADTARGDQITVQVVDEGYWTDRTTLSSVTGRLATVESMASNIWRVVGTTDFGAGFSNMLASVSNVEALVRSSGLSNDASFEAMRIDVSNVFVSVSNLQLVVNSSSISNAAALAALRMDSSNTLIAVTGLASIVSSTTISNAAALAALQMDSSNMLIAVTGLASIVSSTTISNAAALAAMRTDLNSILGSVTNLSSLTNLISLQHLTSLMVLTNLTSLTNLDVTAIQAGIADVQAKVAAVDWAVVRQTAADLTALQASTASSFLALDGRLSELAGIASAIDSLGSDASATRTAADKAAKEARSAKTQSTTIQGAITALKTALGQGDKDSAMAMLGSIKAQLAGMQGSVGSKASMQPVLDLMIPMAGDINALARRKNLDALVTIPDDMRAQTKITEKGMVQVNNKIAEINAAIDFLNKLVDKVANPPEVMIYYTTE